MTAMVQVIIFVFALSVSLRCSMAGDAFLTVRDWAPATAWEANVNNDLLDEIAVHKEIRDDLERRLVPIEQILNKSVHTMQKNAYGKLGHSAVRYMLHRYFVKRHGWFVKGVDPNGGAWNSSSPALVLRGQVPDQVMGFIERRLGGQGFELREIAILAAMVERIVQSEATSRLEAAWMHLDYPIDDGANVTALQVDAALDMYFQLFILGIDITSAPERVIQEVTKNMLKYYPRWPATARFLRQARKTARPKTSMFSFDDAVAVLMQASDTYGHEQDKECQELKNHLLELEERKGSGCVRLTDFYGSSVGGGKWQFSEKPDYLRQLGALDESNPKTPRVLVPNYMGGASNCLASSNYYSVCCLNECETLMDHVEIEIGAPDATPARIIEVVAALHSASVPATRSLPSPLIHRLSDIAQLHGGRVPLHGRLFAQWMHNVYPRECAYPHVSGTTDPVAILELAHQGINTVHSEHEMSLFISEAANHNGSRTNVLSSASCMPWHDKEELFVPWTLAQQEPLEDDPHLWAGFRIAAISSMIVSTTLLLLQTVRIGRHALLTWLVRGGSSKHPSILSV